MKKKNRPVQQAANTDVRMSDVTPPTSTVQVPEHTLKKHRGLTQQGTADILNLYPDAFNAE